MSLAIKYRPRTLGDVVGHETQIRILTNAIKLNRFPNAILLSGMYGRGKTSIARIIARSLNCDVVPCGNCNACNLTTSDIIEIDAASHTGVNDIRELLDLARYLPSEYRYKVFIIDEAHMLSSSAFNALLKSLEEPHEHVKFILVTTEKHKLPETVMSRCMELHLGNIDDIALIEHLKYIAGKEDIRYENAALKLIVESSSGSVRDAVSLLDAISLHNDIVSHDAVREILGIPMRQIIIAILGAILNSDVQGVIDLVRSISGVNPENMIDALLSIVHEITLVKTTDLQPIDDLKEISSQVEFFVLNRIWQIINHSIPSISNAFNYKKMLEMLMIRLCFASGVAQQKVQHEVTPMRDNENKINFNLDTLICKSKESKNEIVHNVLLHEVNKVEIIDNVVYLFMKSPRRPGFDHIFADFIKSQMACDARIKVIDPDSGDCVNNNTPERESMVDMVLDTFDGAELV